ncbi:MAG: hypothetical protein J0M12_09850 [Deltaproteobacteria bacterium]|nr:hypothetical protein [Deltaproteobacteria bacterium]
MKIVVLTTADPGQRYNAHIAALKMLGVDLICISLDGAGLKITKLKRHFGIMVKRGPVSYFEWMKMKRAAAPLRKEVSLRIRSKLGQIANAPIKMHATFSGFSDEAANFIVREKPTFVLQAGVGLVPGDFIKKVPHILNIHPGILPGIRGVEPIFWAHYYGKEDWLGSTLHIIDAHIDKGTPLLRRRFSYVPGMHYADSVVRQIQVEQELLAQFFTSPCVSLHPRDEGGCEKSVYRSVWSREQYHELEQAGWWRARELGT